MKKIYEVEINKYGAPNFATAIEVVRCKECKHWDTADGECYADRGIYFPNPDDFCSYGEKKGADDEAPTIEPKRGEWIEFDTKWGRSLYYCTNCMETTEVPTAFGKPLYDFCPNCGADMREREGE